MRHLAHSYPERDTGLVARLIAQPEDEDGRSEWRWLHLDSGDLMVGFFPRGNSYSDCEQAFTDDWQLAHGNDQIIEHEDADPSNEDWEPGVLEQMVQAERRKEAGSVNTEPETRGCSCGMADYGAPGHDGEHAIGIRDLRLGDHINLREPDGLDGLPMPITSIADLFEEGISIEVLDPDGDTWVRRFNAPKAPSFTVHNEEGDER